MRVSCFIGLALLWLATGMAPTVHAEYRIATVDINRVLNDSKEAAAKRQELEKKSIDIRKKFEDRSKKLRDTEQKMKDGKLAEDSKEAKQFRSDARDFGREVKEAEEDLKSDFMKFNKGLADKALKAVADYAKANNIDLVLDRGDKARGPVLFGDASHDITDAIVEIMNK